MHLGCFHIMVTVNNGEMNNGVHISLQNPDFYTFGYTIKSEMAILICSSNVYQSINRVSYHLFVST